MAGPIAALALDYVLPAMLRTLAPWDERALLTILIVVMVSWPLPWVLFLRTPSVADRVSGTVVVRKRHR